LGKFKEYGLPCPCGSGSDPYALDFEGGGYCFSCGTYFPPYKNHNKEELEDFMIDITYDYYPYRGLTKKTVEFYDILTRFHDGEPYSRAFRYNQGKVKVKKYAPESRRDKYSFPDGAPTEPFLYGMDKFTAGSKKAVYITEGEDDAASVWQAMGGTVAAVSIQSSSTALRDIKHCREYLNSFDKIVLAFDADEAGRKALQQVICSGLFDFNKLYYVDFKLHKDANEYLQNSQVNELVSELKTAKKYTPDNIISTFEEIREALKEGKENTIGTYPTESLNHLLYGLYRGQVVLLKAQSGVGKTEMFRLMEDHLLKTSEVRLGVIHMEEDKATTIKGFATYELGIPCNLPDSGISDDQIIEAYQKAVGGKEDRVYIYTMFGGDDPDDVLDSIRFLVASAGVDIVFLDHITLLVTGTEEGDERRKLDYLSTKLKKMAKELNFCLVMISHVNDDGQTRGSRNIEKIADTIIHLWRDKLSEDEIEKNTLRMTVEKNRLAGRTGQAEPLYFNTETFKLQTEAPL